jgi:hypothetical protein
MAEDLFDRYIVPPFTILDTRQGYWRGRRNLWNSFGLDSGDGRDDNITFGYEMINSGVSIFDPVLTELMYRWFSPKGGSIFDPFSGGSVRGIVAAKIGSSYTGVDLRQVQVDANLNQIAKVCPGASITYHVGDSLDIPDMNVGSNYDMIFSCPPYGHLEVYSDDPRDLSNMSVLDFIANYKKIISHSSKLLANNRFAAFVVGNYRDKKGRMVDFVGHTISAFEESGLSFYNKFIIVNAVGTLRLRVGAQFDASRKAGLVHQEVVVFVKGDPKQATLDLGAVDPKYPGGVFDSVIEDSVMDLFGCD